MRLMQRCLLSLGAVLAVMVTGCEEKPAEVEVDTTRPLTSSDRAPKLNATSQERFERSAPHGGMGAVTGPAKPATYEGTVPEGWVVKPGAQFRLLNYAIGENGAGEVYVSQTRGDLLGNVARWRRQFGITETTGDDLVNMDRVVVMGTGEGLLVEASGTFSPGMGRPAAPGHAMTGVVGVLADGGVFTVKMTGPEDVVKAERERFLEFCRSLRMVE